jgi:ABC-2 type transport system permease protein
MSITYLRLEILRLLRNRRVIVFTMITPAVLLLIFGGINKSQSINGVSGASYVMVGMALFGAMSAAITTGGTIAVERGLGWNRQLRLTPLRPGGYALGKLLLSLLVALPPLLVAYLVGAVALGVRLSAGVWAQVLAGSWLSALPFAALGLVIGYLAKPDSVQPISGLIYMLLAAFGGLWVPVEIMPRLMRTIASYTPAYWAGQVARGPLFHGELSLRAVGVLLAWAVGLAVIGLRLFRADTARV